MDTQFQDSLTENKIKYQEWEKEYGNATENLLKENRELTLKRAKRYMEMFYEALQRLDFEVTGNTEHTV